jgi:hypothetical protein
MNTIGMSADDRQPVLDGELVTVDAKAVSGRDLAVSMAFLVKTSPESLSRQVISGSLITADAQVQAYGDADIQESFFWMRSIIHGKPTYVRQQTMAVADDNARAVMQRQYYVSTGYNGEQAVAGFLPVRGGTLVFYSSHAFTDQVSGFGGSVKRSIGSRVMADQLEKTFEAGRTKAVK